MLFGRRFSLIHTVISWQRAAALLLLIPLLAVGSASPGSPRAQGSTHDSTAASSLPHDPYFLDTTLNANAGDAFFGNSAISADGNTLLVGAEHHSGAVDGADCSGLVAGLPTFTAELGVCGVTRSGSRWAQAAPPPMVLGIPLVSVLTARRR